MAELLAGCGHNREKHIKRPARHEWDGLVTLDHDPDCGADIVHDLDVLPYPFPDNTFDEIHCYHCLEHLGRQGDWRFFFNQWTEFWRIAKPKGTFHGVVPHWQSPWAWGDPSHTRIISQECLAFLNQKNYEAVGKTTMADFRGFYKVSWELAYANVTDANDFVFLLVAVK